jgi:hypothetical protein
MFRDRVVSMEQTLEGGEKNLELLKALCLEALPDFRYREHSLDHERDLFVMALEAPDGRRKSVGWTRMILFDAERIPALVADPSAPVRGRILQLLRDQSGRAEIVVTFRHLEEGWVDTPEPRPSRRRRRRGGGRGAGRPQESPQRGRPSPPRPPEPRPRPAPPAQRPAAGQAPPGNRPPSAPGEPRPPGSRRRFRRRRRGRGGGGGGGGGSGAQGGPPRQ